MNTDPTPTIQPGRYRHFKGGEYEVIGVAQDSENRDEYVVVYRLIKYDRLMVRPYEMFIEHVDKPEYNYQGPRFAKIDD